jgi:hypothetical protein
MRLTTAIMIAKTKMGTAMATAFVVESGVEEDVLMVEGLMLVEVYG